MRRPRHHGFSHPPDATGEVWIERAQGGHAVVVQEEVETGGEGAPGESLDQAYGRVGMFRELGGEDAPRYAGTGDRDAQGRRRVRGRRRHLFAPDASDGHGELSKKEDGGDPGGRAGESGTSRVCDCTAAPPAQGLGRRGGARHLSHFQMILWKKNWTSVSSTVSITRHPKFKPCLLPCVSFSAIIAVWTQNYEVFS